MSLPINIDELLNGHTVEWERIECKKGWNPEDILHTIVAFANDINNWGGGYILIGVEETCGVIQLPPFGMQHAQIDKMQKEILDISHRIQPYYAPVIQPYLSQGKQILVLWVPGGDNRPYKCPSTLGKQPIFKY